jgi:hypothetical protein
VERVLFYCGEPDFPDPMAGLAPIAEWRFVCLPDHRSVHVPLAAENTTRLADWCAKQLPGFAVATLEEALTLSREGHWLLWSRETSR